MVAAVAVVVVLAILTHRHLDKGSLAVGISLAAAVFATGLLAIRRGDRRAGNDVRPHSGANEADARMTKIGSQVPGMLFQLKQFPDGRRCFPFASAGIGDPMPWGATAADAR